MSKSNKKIQLKSLFIITICLLIVSTNIHAYQLTPECNVTIEHNRYIIHFVLPDYNIETEDDDDCGVFSQIDMAADYGTTDDPGYPSIPYFKLNLLIPQGATNTTVSFTINDLEVITLSDPLIPSKMGDIINENNNFSQLDEGCYNQEYYQYGYTGEFPNGYYPKLLYY